MIKYKEGVPHNTLNWRMRKAIGIAAQIWAEHGKELVVTSTTDGEHSERSWHYYGCAIDLRTRYFTPAEVRVVSRKLRNQLPKGYQVVLHSSHLHLEYDHDSIRESVPSP